MKPIYFDNNATTMVAPEVTEAMIPFFKEYWGNPSSMHTFGGQVAKYVDEGRQKVADMLKSSSPPVPRKVTIPPSGPHCRLSRPSGTSSPLLSSIRPSCRHVPSGNARATA